MGELVLDTCRSQEMRWQKTFSAVKEELTSTAQSEEQLAFMQAEQRTRDRRVEKQRRDYFARFESAHFGGNAKSLEAASERYRLAANLPRPKAKTALGRALSLLFVESSPCSIEALESTLDALHPEPSSSRSRPNRNAPTWSFKRSPAHSKEAYRKLRPPDPEKSFAFVDVLADRLARFEPRRPVGLLLEGEAGQATNPRFQEVTHGGVAGWVFRNFLLGTGVPVRFQEPDGVAGPEFAELLDRLTPKNKRSGNSFRGKPTAEIEFIHEGQELHQNLVEVIDSAQSFLNLSTLDWKRDRGEKEIAYRLMAKKLGLDGQAFEDFLDTFSDGLPLDPGGPVSRFYDLPPNRIKNLLIYYFFRTSKIPEVADSRRPAEELLGGELRCPSLANCGDLSALLEQARGHYDPGRASDRGYAKVWEMFQKFQNLFEPETRDLKKVAPHSSLADCVTDRDRLHTFVRRYGRKRSDDPSHPFALNIIVDGKQDLYNVRWHRPNSRYPYLFSDTIWDIYVPLYDFDIALVLWKGIIEFPWHVGPLPWGGRKIFGAPSPMFPTLGWGSRLVSLGREASPATSSSSTRWPPIVVPGTRWLCAARAFRMSLWPSKAAWA